LTRFLSPSVAAATAVVLVLFAPESSPASNRGLVAAVDRFLPLVRGAGAGARSGDPDAVQRQYDVARDLAEAVDDAGRVSASCESFRTAAVSLAAAETEQAEGVDRLEPDRTEAGRRGAVAATRRLLASRRDCVAHSPEPAGQLPLDLLFDSPASGAVEIGSTVRLVARVPSGAGWATAVRLDQPARFACRPSEGHVRLSNGRLAIDVGSVRLGRHDISLAFCAPAVSGSRPRVLGIARARGVWVLPGGARRPLPGQRPSPARSARLTRAAETFGGGYSGIWTEDLVSGETAGWNADARFPAASTVKLGLLIAALRRAGPRPESSRLAYDLDAMARWSSNLATNRLLVEVGGSQPAGSQLADAVLKQLGAVSSTFTGGYRVGTALRQRAGEPPLISSRVTTAHDLARILLLLHAGAVLGDRSALRRLGISKHAAEYALGLLLSSDQTFKDNVGLFRPALGPYVPIAQKNGWFSVVRHTAAIVYSPTGPKLVVLLTYRPGLTPADAQLLGTKVLSAVDL
jgi:beta-lactamase class A